MGWGDARAEVGRRDGKPGPFRTERAALGVIP